MASVTFSESVCDAEEISSNFPYTAYYSIVLVQQKKWTDFSLIEDFDFLWGTRMQDSSLQRKQKSAESIILHVAQTSPKWLS